MPIDQNFPQFPIYRGSVPPIGDVPKAHPKDPRILRYPPYMPFPQADQTVYHNIRARTRLAEQQLEYGPEQRNRIQGLGRNRFSRNPLTWADDHTFINATPLQQAPSIVNMTAVNSPVLLLKKNVRRLSFTIACQSTDTVYMSYGPPIRINGAVNTFAGIPISPAIGAFAHGNGWFPGSNGQASIDDIYVWVDMNGTVPQIVLGYEGTLAPINDPVGGF